MQNKNVNSKNEISVEWTGERFITTAQINVK